MSSFFSDATKTTLLAFRHFPHAFCEPPLSPSHVVFICPVCNQHFSPSHACIYLKRCVIASRRYIHTWRVKSITSYKYLHGECKASPHGMHHLSPSLNQNTTLFAFRHVPDAFCYPPLSPSHVVFICPVCNQHFSPSHACIYLKRCVIASRRYIHTWRVKSITSYKYLHGECKASPHGMHHLICSNTPPYAPHLYPSASGTPAHTSPSHTCISF